MSVKRLESLDARVRSGIRACERSLARDRLSQYLLVTVALDFAFTTIGMATLGPRWEVNPLYRIPWQNGDYLEYLWNWGYLGFLFPGLLILVSAPIKLFFHETRYTLGLLFVNLAILYVATNRLYNGPVLWSMALGCNYSTTISSCVAAIRSSPALSFLFRILDRMFPHL